MASVSTSLSPTSLHLNQRLDLDSIRTLISVVDRHIHRFLSDPIARKSLQLKCSAKLTTASHRYFEFFEHSVLSSLYWGMESLELAVRTESSEERMNRLLNSERMLQVPALMEEEGSTAGMANCYLVCCSYFYLSLVRKLRGDEWQMTMHFLQSLLVSPQLMRTELAPELWKSLFGTLNSGEIKEEVDETVRQQARRYKAWLMYYQVVLYGEIPPCLNECSPPQISIRESTNSGCRNFSRTRYLDSMKQAYVFPDFHDAKMVNPLEQQENIKREMTSKASTSTSNSADHEASDRPDNRRALFMNLDEHSHPDSKEGFDMRCLQDMLEESQSDTSVSFYSNIDSAEVSDSEVKRQKESPTKILSATAEILAAKICQRNCLSLCSPPARIGITEPESPTTPIHVEMNEEKESYLLPRRSHSSLDNLKFSILDLRDVESHHFSECHIEDEIVTKRSPTRDFRCFSNFSSKFLKRYSLPELVPHGSFASKRLNFSSNETEWSKDSSNYEKDAQTEMLGRFEKAVSSLCLSEHPGKCKDAGLEVTMVWEILKNKAEVKYSSLKQEILDQLLEIISTSKKEKVIKASVSILLVLISEDRTVIEEIRKKGLQLYDLASALKKNVYEAATLIYLLNPSPSEIKHLELLPALVEVACNSNNQKEGPISLPLTPTSASIAMIEILVTRFDYVTNNMHLATISSPQVLSKLVNVALNKNLEESIGLAAILVRCMRLNGNCKKFLSQVTPVDPFLHLLRSNERRAKFAALEYFHEILCMPRTSVICLLNQIRQQGGISIMHTLMACIQQAELEHRILAANLLLQLDMLEWSRGKSIFKEEAMEVLLYSVASEENSSTQILSAFILSNLGGTYTWTGEPYTAAWLVKKAGLTSMYHRNMIKNIDWFDPCLQDREIDAWTSKIARGIIKLGSSVFTALAKGIQSKTKSVAHDCLICITWLGSEMAVIGPSKLRYFACGTLMNGIAQFLHPGSHLDERILACLCVYNYTSGKGKQKLMNFSEGLRESLRRLSGITWMAEELLKVTDYFLPTKSRVSCVHTQNLEANHVGSGAVTALIFYKGYLHAGYSDGSIKSWELKGHRALLMWEVKEHKRPVTCFTLFEPGDRLLSGSSDRTIRVWQMVQKKLECVEVIEMKEPVHKVDSCGERILVITQGRGLKVCHPSRSIQTICRNKHVKCLAGAQGKFYLGCSDSSIQEVDIMEDHNKEIRSPAKSWNMRSKSISSIHAFKSWVYCASLTVEGSSIKDWRRHSRPQFTIAMERGTNVQAMAVVEDFIYLNCSSSPNILQIWLREKQQKIGRLSAGSKITSMLTANDIVLCGTETGVIKGWIPL